MAIKHSFFVSTKVNHYKGALLGYVCGILSLGPSPNLLRSGGTTTITTGPMLPMTME